MFSAIATVVAAVTSRESGTAPIEPGIGLVAKAVKIFWEIHGLDTNFVNIDNSGVYWVKNANPPVKWEWYEDFNSTKRAETY